MPFGHNAHGFATSHVPEGLWQVFGCRPVVAERGISNFICLVAVPEADHENVFMGAIVGEHRVASQAGQLWPDLAPQIDNFLGLSPTSSAELLFYALATPTVGKIAHTAPIGF